MPGHNRGRRRGSLEQREAATPGTVSLPALGPNKGLELTASSVRSSLASASSRSSCLAFGFPGKKMVGLRLT
jgi:hypothetical protein